MSRDFLMAKWPFFGCGTPRQAAGYYALAADIVESRAGFFRRRVFHTDRPSYPPAGGCEGTSTLFEVDYFDDSAYLTQSGQLYIAATSDGRGTVYSFGPQRFAPRIQRPGAPARVFWMVEPEVLNADWNDIT